MFNVPSFFGFKAAAPYVGLLDLYPNAAAAYSLRLLNTAYTGAAIRVRVDIPGDPEFDIGFTSSGELDTATLLSVVGANDAYIDTWYDQSGNIPARDATQGTAANQPQIVSSGSVITTNSKPSMQLNGSSQFLQFSTLVPSTNQSIFGVGKRNSAGTSMAFISNDIGGINSALLYFSDNNIYYLANGMYLQTTATNLSLNLQLVNGYLLSGSATSIYRNGTLLTTSTVSVTVSQAYSHIGKYGSSNFSNCNFSEIIYYESDQLANNAAIQTNINDFYSIYP